MKNLKIAVVDSGIGGLSLLKTLMKNLDVVNYVYLADLKNIPYGSKTREQLLCLTIKNVKMLIKKYNPDAIVFGCNTIGTTIFEDIKKIFPKQKFFTIRPNIEDLRLKTLVLATSGTIDALANTNIYKKNKKHIVLCKMFKLATKVENYIQNGTNLVPYIKNKLCKFRDIDNIVLGCTHYYFVKNIIANLFPNARIVDGTELVAKQINNFFKLPLNKKTKIRANLNEKSVCSNNIKITWCLTDKKNNLKIYKKIVNDFNKN